jgi:hypothetical protein
VPVGPPVSHRFWRVKGQSPAPCQWVKNSPCEAMTDESQRRPRKFVEWKTEVDKHYAAIGLVTANWSYFEAFLDMWIQRFAEIWGDVGVCLTSQIAGPARKIDALISLIRLRGVSDPSPETLDVFSKKVQGLAEQRNRVAHDLWDLSDPKLPARLKEKINLPIEACLHRTTSPSSGVNKNPDQRIGFYVQESLQRVAARATRDAAAFLSRSHLPALPSPRHRSTAYMKQSARSSARLLDFLSKILKPTICATAWLYCAQAYIIRLS